MKRNNPRDLERKFALELGVNPDAPKQKKLGNGLDKPSKPRNIAPKPKQAIDVYEEMFGKKKKKKKAKVVQFEMCKKPNAEDLPIEIMRGGAQKAVQNCKFHPKQCLPPKAGLNFVVGAANAGIKHRKQNKEFYECIKKPGGINRELAKRGIRPINK